MQSKLNKSKQQTSIIDEITKESELAKMKVSHSGHVACFLMRNTEPKLNKKKKRRKGITNFFVHIKNLIDCCKLKI